MPIDISNKEEKQIALTGAEIESALLQAHLSRDAIEKIEGLVASAREIDNNIRTIELESDNGTSTSYFGTKSINILGDSTSIDSDSYASRLVQGFMVKNSSPNFGFVPEGKGWDVGATKVVNALAPNSLTGTFISLAIDETRTFESAYEIWMIFSEKSYATYFYDNTQIGLTFTIQYLKKDDTLISSSLFTTDSSGKTALTSIPTDTYKLKVVNTSGVILRIENPQIIVDSAKYTANRLGTSGRALFHVDNGVLDKWFDGAEYAILGLNTNDRNPDYYSSFAAKIDYIQSKFNDTSNTKTKLIILDLNVKDDESTAMTIKLRDLNKNCNGSYYLSAKEVFKTYDVTEMVTLGYIKADKTHPTNLGAKLLSNAIYKMLNLGLTVDEVANINFRYNKYKTYLNTFELWTGANFIGTNLLLGKNNGSLLTTGFANLCIGENTARDITTGWQNINLGYQAGQGVTTGNRLINIGAYAGQSGGAATTGVNIGDEAGQAISSGQAYVNIGKRAGKYLQDGNTAYSSINVLCLGADAKVSGSNQVQLGTSGMTTYAYGAVQDRSDIRDKADIEATPLGLDFICKVNPVQYRWDYRDDYILIDEETGDATILEKDGSKKRSRLHQGVIAQQVKEVIDELGVDFGGYQDHSLSGGCDIKSIGYQEFIPPLIKAIQELKTEIEILKAKA